MELPRKYLLFVLLYVFGLALIEIIWCLRNRRAYAWRETLASLMVLIIRRAFFVGLTAQFVHFLAVKITPYQILSLPVLHSGHFHLLNAVLLFFGIEFFYYWFHRWSHEIRFMWASHSVHHSPNSMNFLTAERLSWTGGETNALLITAPLILLGFDAKTVTVGVALNLLYQYWLHTEMIGRLGFLELIFNTPAHHRIHHASNASYLDANYGGVLIIFDRLFGTLALEHENEKIVYGLVKPYFSMNPVIIAFHEWMAIARDLFSAWRKPIFVFKYLFAAPGWSPDGSRRTSKQLRAEWEETHPKAG